MAVMELLFGRKTATQFLGQGGLGELILDATLSEDGEFSNRITNFPIESGSAISDHVIRDPETVTIQGFVTNTPIYILGNAGAAYLREGEYKEPMLDAYEFLLGVAGYSTPKANPNGRLGARLVDPLTQPVLVDILTEFRAYTDMALERLSVPRRPETGDSLEFTASFKKVRTVNVQYDLASTSDATGAPRTTKKAAPNKPTGPAGADKTVPLESAAHIWAF